MRQNSDFHQRALAKEDVENDEIEDMGELAEEHYGVWVFLVEKG